MKCWTRIIRNLSGTFFTVWTDPRLGEPVEKTDNGYRRVQRRCLKLRRDGSIPYGCIADATRRGHHVATFDGKADFIGSMAGLYRAQLWTDAMPHVEVWCESRSLAGVLQPECKRLAVSLYPSGGFSSVTLPYDAACEIDRKGRDEAVVMGTSKNSPFSGVVDLESG